MTQPLFFCRRGLGLTVAIAMAVIGFISHIWLGRHAAAAAAPRIVSISGEAMPQPYGPPLQAVQDFKQIADSSAFGIFVLAPLPPATASDIYRLDRP